MEVVRIMDLVVLLIKLHVRRIKMEDYVFLMEHAKIKHVKMPLLQMKPMKHVLNTCPLVQ